MATGKYIMINQPIPTPPRSEVQRIAVDRIVKMTIPKRFHFGLLRYRIESKWLIRELDTCPSKLQHRREFSWNGQTGLPKADPALRDNPELATSIGPQAHRSLPWAPGLRSRNYFGGVGKSKGLRPYLALDRLNDPMHIYTIKLILCTPGKYLLFKMCLMAS